MDIDVRLSHLSDKYVAFPFSINAPENFKDSWVHRDASKITVFSMPDVDSPFIQIEVGPLKTKGLSNSAALETECMNERS